MVEVDSAPGAAMRRRRRRLRQFLRHFRLTVAMGLADSSTTPHEVRRLPGKGDELHGDAPGEPTSQPELFELSDEEPGGPRPDCLAGVRPQERVQQHAVEQIVDAVPGLPSLDAPVPLVVEQLVDVLALVEERGWTSSRTT